MKFTKEDIIGGKKLFKWCDSGEPNTHGEELLNYDSDIQEIIWNVCSNINIPEDELEYSVVVSTKLIEFDKLREVYNELQKACDDADNGWWFSDLLDRKFGEVLEVGVKK